MGRIDDMARPGVIECGVLEFRRMGSAPVSLAEITRLWILYREAVRLSKEHPSNVMVQEEAAKAQSRVVMAQAIYFNETHLGVDQ